MQLKVKKIYLILGYKDWAKGIDISEFWNTYIVLKIQANFLNAVNCPLLTDSTKLRKMKKYE